MAAISTGVSRPKMAHKSSTRERAGPIPPVGEGPALSSRQVSSFYSEPVLSPAVSLHWTSWYWTEMIEVAGRRRLDPHS